MQLITVENQSSIVSAADLTDVVDALEQQFSQDFNRGGWVKRGIAPAITVQELPAGQAPPAGAWNLVLLDTTDQQGALGYHDDENGDQIPYSDIFCKTCEQDGVSWQSCASHEALEMAVDPYVNPPKMVEDPSNGRFYIVEVCDAVQGFSYFKTTKSGKQIEVSDFVLPSWYGTKWSSYRPCSFKGNATQPWQVTSGGYISYQLNGSWHQIFGEKRKAHPAWASRLPRIHPEAMVVAS